MVGQAEVGALTTLTRQVVMGTRLAAEGATDRASQIAAIDLFVVLTASLRSGDPSSRSKTGDDLKFQIRPAAEPANEQGRDRSAAT